MSSHSQDDLTEYKAATLDDLVFRQTEAMRSVERSLENFKKIGKSKMTFGVVRNRLKNLKESFSKCQRLHDQLLFQATSEDIEKEQYFATDRFLQCEDAYNTASDYMADILASLENSPSTSTSSVSLPTVPVRSSFQLPQIQLPTFSGKFHEWESFRDKFKAMIINNAELTGISKLHYLGSSLSGEASEILRHLAITENNFDIAWTLLTARYENKRRLINVHLDALHKLPRVNSESAQEIRTLRDKANVSIQALKNLKRSVDTWDDMLVYLLTRSLDQSSRKAWELKIGNTDDYPTYKDLDKFLEARVRALEAIPSTYSVSNRKFDSPSNVGKPRHVSSHVVIQNHLKCPMCQANHFLSQCASFKEKEAFQRVELIKKMATVYELL